MMKDEKLRLIAVGVIKAWNAWCEAEGWDNPAYDGFSDALGDMEYYLAQPKAADTVKTLTDEE